MWKINVSTNYNFYWIRDEKILQKYEINRLRHRKKKQ
jgi:hypothetical protein